jgi:ribonuclease J
MTKKRLRIIPIGGLGEIGKNMLAIEYGDDIIVIDAGLMFPQEDMPGVDSVIPDISYLLKKKEHVRGIIITHGHEDHIGGLPYILPQLNVPVYATKLAKDLIALKLKERRNHVKSQLHTIQSGTPFNLGVFKIEPYSVCHSIPDAVGLIIQSPLGLIVHSGDFKIDYTPVDGRGTDLSRLAQACAKGALLLLSDSTYAELPGYTPSESVVGETLNHIIGEAKGRVFIATFASLISRIQQVIDAAVAHERYVFIIGRSMKDIVRMSIENKYLNAPSGTIRSIDELRKFPHNKVVVLMTGSQGEPTSALVRVANQDNEQIKIMPGDTVIMSASPIPGNEGLVGRTMDNLFRQGANVIYSRLAQVHVHGHGSQEELKLLLNLVKPKYFVPVHGEYRHLCIHGKLAKSVGIEEKNIFVMENGHILEIDSQQGQIAGKIPSDNIYVDGLVLGDSANVILRDRKLLSRDGIVIVTIAIDRSSGKVIGMPDILSRGFVDTRACTGFHSTYAQG